MSPPIRVDDDEPFLSPKPEPLVAYLRVDDVLRTLLVARHLNDGQPGGPLPLLLGAIALHLVETHRDPTAQVEDMAGSLHDLIGPLQEWKLACQRPAGSA